MGYNVMGSLGLQPAARAFGVRFDAMYHQLGFTDFDEKLGLLGGAGNVVLTVANSGTVRPYVIGGAGVYRLDYPTADIEDETSFGLNGGGGVEFGLAGLRSFVEVRLHSIFTEGGNSNFVPLVFGFKF
jgi:hypothetical protein